LRPGEEPAEGTRFICHVREHPAPSGALRPGSVHPQLSSTSQGAPSTIRCIETAIPTT